MITVAKNAGFCFGVRRATDTVEKLIDEKRENEIICTQGKLIHNEEYNKFCADNDLKRKPERLAIAQWDRKQGAMARAAAKKAENNKGEK